MNCPEYIVEEIIMEATQEDGTIIKKRVKINNRKLIKEEEWEDI